MSTISVIIPTYNRYPVILETIEYLLPEVKVLKGELIVVDQSDKDIALKIAEHIKNEKTIKYIYCSKPSLQNARNIGIKNSKGEIIVFLDDDVIPDPQLLQQHINGYNRDNAIGCVAGRVIEEGKLIKNSTKPGINVTFWGKVLRNSEYDKFAFVQAPQGCNMSFKREVLNKVGPFDTYYKGNAILEETDYGFRVRKAGYKILFSPHASLTHLLTPSGGCRVLNAQEKEFYIIRNATRFFLKNKLNITIPIIIFTLLLTTLKRLHKVESLHKILKLWLSATREGLNSFLYEKVSCNGN